MKTKVIVITGLLIALVACGPAPTAAPTATSTPVPTFTPSPTFTPTPTATSTPAPTATPTSTPKPTSTPTATPEPTATPMPWPEEAFISICRDAPEKMCQVIYSAEEFLDFEFLAGDRLVGWPAGYALPEVAGFSWEDAGDAGFRLVEQ